MLLTACDDMHAHLYDVEHATLIEAFSGAGIPPSAPEFRASTTGIAHRKRALDIQHEQSAQDHIDWLGRFSTLSYPVPDSESG